MKTYFYVGAAVAAVLSCSAVNAQVLGGNVAGGLGGAMQGGLRDTSVMTQGHGNGAFGADLDTGSRIGTLRDTSSDVTGRVRNRTRDTAGDVRGRTESTIGKAKSRGEGAASATANTASDAVTTVRHTEAPQFDATGSLNSAAGLTSEEASGSLNATHQVQAISSPVSAPQVDSPAATPAQPASEAQPLKPVKEAEIASDGGANGNASASKRGVNASADGSANASVQR
jgi:hypothetical protein